LVLPWQERTSLIPTRIEFDGKARILPGFSVW
jgi:hypothetical protein